MRGFVTFLAIGWFEIMLLSVIAGDLILRYDFSGPYLPTLATCIGFQVAVPALAQVLWAVSQLHPMARAVCFTLLGVGLTVLALVGTVWPTEMRDELARGLLLDVTPGLLLLVAWVPALLARPERHQDRREPQDVDAHS